MPAVDFKTSESIRIAGIMSGTSLDGVDIALCCFYQSNSGIWNYKIEKAETFPYTKEWKEKLIQAETSSGLELILLHKEYGEFLGSLINKFIRTEKEKPEYISSHGHTIFHQPQKKLTFQLGDGACIAAESGINTVSDFRSFDVALGGQGAPLVPIGDKLLFGNYDQCLNLGGFANISYDSKETRIAYDICPVNILLNYVCQIYFNTDFDNNGAFGKIGNVDLELFNTMNQLDYFQKSAPKSLGKEWVVEKIFPLLPNKRLEKHDILRTLYEHIAFQISAVCNAHPGHQILVTGGGAFNTFLIELLKSKINKVVILPEKTVIEFKEALIFAFLGLLRIKNIPNCIATVTGAREDNLGGTLHIIK